jgi:cytochrome b subunit of formate dehydrogenase
MTFMKWSPWVVIGVLFALAGGPLAEAGEPAASSPAAAVPGLENGVCLACHGNEGFSAPAAEGKSRALFVHGQKFEGSVHGKLQCVQCHQDITAVPHDKTVRKVSCINCHEQLWQAAQRQGTTAENARLGVVASQIQLYLKSVHARPSRADQSFTNAACYDCHAPHYVYPAGTQQHTEWKLSLPDTCGACHTKSKQEYLQSVHAELAVKQRIPGVAVCSDCHSGHDIQPMQLTSSQLAVIENCGNCHAQNYRSYTDTYHGQVSMLGYGYTAKCYDCHASHTIKRVSDPGSRVHPNNRLATCRECHANASEGFLTFQPHANTHDFNRYPAMWLTSKFMIALLIGVFAFFWTHSALWFYREYRDRKEGKHRPHVATAELPPELRGKHFRRFAWGWRLAHLVFAISVMILVLTGMAVFYADTDWAKAVMAALGGPRIAGLIHRTAATIMLSIFFVHLVVVVARIWRMRDSFDWMGPTSLVPSLKDLSDAQAMFKWFFGQGPRPVFDRWTYWEKFDYWAVFWGMAIIGGSGFLLWFPGAASNVLPGWIFNIATLIHGEEAFLAAVFLFTVHFFNNHFRPEKYPPPDIVMFTGTVALEEFKREHTLEYERLRRSGELQKYLVDAPPRPMTIGSRILGFTLIIFGLVLLVLVITGFIDSLTGPP